MSKLDQAVPPIAKSDQANRAAFLCLGVEDYRSHAEPRFVGCSFRLANSRGWKLDPSR